MASSVQPGCPGHLITAKSLLPTGSQWPTYHVNNLPWAAKGRNGQASEQAGGKNAEQQHPHNGMCPSVATSLAHYHHCCLNIAATEQPGVWRGSNDVDIECENGKGWPPPALCFLPTCSLACLDSSPSARKPSDTSTAQWLAHPPSCPVVSCPYSELAM